MFQRDYFETNPATGKPEFTISLGRYSPHNPGAVALVEALTQAGALCATDVDNAAHKVSKIGVGLSGVHEKLYPDMELLAEGHVHTDAIFIQAFDSALTNQTLVDMMAKLARGGSYTSCGFLLILGWGFKSRWLHLTNTSFVHFLISSFMITLNVVRWPAGMQGRSNTI